jgi:hypothetical protein
MSEPIAEQTRTPDPGPGQDSAIEPAASILIVDDEPNLRRMLRSYLRI